METKEVDGMSVETGPEPRREAGDGVGNNVRQVVVTPREVSAAKLQVTVDKRLRRKTPDWIVRLSKAERHSA
ncbi:hypothetical protein [Georgenia subflava]|uniref:Uncharacterized protein n=1 Tax=Georgenia subflava TaxID=1622177 RepID=A0A6N7EBJ5_9MICO|nr:hypothetical protein [Georgenia subflava]MPV35509.1 hypothetical protein [Georgenia subflava]